MVCVITILWYGICYIYSLIRYLLYLFSDMVCVITIIKISFKQFFNITLNCHHVHVAYCIWIERRLSQPSTGRKSESTGPSNGNNQYSRRSIHLPDMMWGNHCRIWWVITGYGLTCVTNKTWLWEQYGSLRTGTSKLEWFGIYCQAWTDQFVYCHIAGKIHVIILNYGIKTLLFSYINIVFCKPK